MSQSEGPGPASGAPSDPVGSVAEEAAKLFGAVAGWAREHGDGLSTLTEQLGDNLGDDLHDHLGTGDASCTWCPVCRTVNAIRQTSPEVRAHLAGAASSLMLAVSGMMATQPPARDGGVERIDLDQDDDGDWPEDDR
ncbi:hypothetical protein [Nocardioides cynanchi]|uniref:hypothetical protein n=1 Tax=Nocardioides cynanchi TaxID=2558918 RepID=UPI0012442A08|nr:hypothetical protein [Nocardioides cynanchi]